MIAQIAQFYAKGTMAKTGYLKWYEFAFYNQPNVRSPSVPQKQVWIALQKNAFATRGTPKKCSNYLYRFHILNLKEV